MRTIEDIGANWLARTGEAEEIIGGLDAVSAKISGPSGEDWARAAEIGTVWTVLATISMGASAYHGYKRNESLGWALWWGLMGSLFPVITPVIGLAQGFAEPGPGHYGRRYGR